MAKKGNGAKWVKRARRADRERQVRACKRRVKGEPFGFARGLNGKQRRVKGEPFGFARGLNGKQRRVKA